MADFELYVSKEKFTSEIGQLESRLSALNSLLGDYQALKDRATKVWGSEDENLAKAQATCQSAIDVVRKKIEETQQSKDALTQVLQTAETIQRDMGSKLDDAQQVINSLL
jgi:chromosome segregation ATPase